MVLGCELGGEKATNIWEVTSLLILEELLFGDVDF